MTPHGTPPDLFYGVRTVLLVHAHPDDETLATGGLIAELAGRGIEVAVLTATRGEMGEVVAGPLSHLAGTPALSAHREREVERACRALGVRHGAFLGEPPARADGRRPRRYTDSGMRWLDEAETLAGPGDQAGPDALSVADPAEVALDIAAYGSHLGADLLISYDAAGGYGHPDHVALHEPTRVAASGLGVRFVEVVSQPDAAAPGDGQGRVQTVVAEQHAGVVQAALRQHASQLVVEGTEVVHVGGQRQPVQLTFTLREP